MKIYYISKLKKHSQKLRKNVSDSSGYLLGFISTQRSQRAQRIIK